MQFQIALDMIPKIKTTRHTIEFESIGFNNSDAQLY